MLSEYTYSTKRINKLVGPLVTSFILTLAVLIIFKLGDRLPKIAVYIILAVFGVIPISLMYLILRTYKKQDEGSTIGIDYQKEKLYYSKGDLKREISFNKIKKVKIVKGNSASFVNPFPFDKLCYTTIEIEEEEPIIYTSVLADDLFNDDFYDIKEKKQKMFPFLKH